MGKFKIHPIVVGSKIFDKTMMTYQYGYGETYGIPIYSWYIEGNGRKIVIDTGEFAPARSISNEKAIGGKVYTIEEGLARWDIAPEDIDTVIHTHLHNDHCENDDKFTNATFYAHELEIRRIHDPHPLDFRYMEDYILDIESNGQLKAVSNKEMEIVPGIQVVHTPAHTEGGQSVVVETDGGKAVITGFCCIMENFRPPPSIRGLDMDVIPPGTHVNVYESYDIMRKVRDMADILIPLHEPGFVGVDEIP